MTDVAALRFSLRWSQAKLAQCVGCNQSTIDRIEGGQKPSGTMALVLERLSHLSEEHPLAEMLVPDVVDLLVGRCEPPYSLSASV